MTIGVQRKSNRQSMLSAFSRSLNAALYDSALQYTNHEVIHVFDASMIVPILIGAENLYDEYAEIGSTSRLVMALWSAGLLGPVVVTQQHMIEIYEQSRRIRYDERGEKADFKTRRDNFLRNADMGHAMDTFRHHGVIDDARKLAKYLSSVGDSAAEAFCAMEFSIEPFHLRLSRVLSEGLLRIDQARGKHSGSFGEETWRTEINLRKERGDPMYSRRNMRDAITIGRIGEMLEEGQRREYRFATRTPAVKKVIEESEILREVFRARTTSVGQLLFGLEPYLTEELVTREPLYYLIRCVFPELSISDPECESEVFRDLHMIAITLSEAETIGRDIESELRRLWVGRQRLNRVLNRLTSLRFVETVLAHPAQRGTVKKLRDRWLEGIDAIALQDQLHDRIDQVELAVKAQVSQTLDMERAFVRITTAIDREGMETNVPPDPLRDAGMVRWGVTDEKILMDIGIYLRALGEGSRERRRRECARLAWRIAEQPHSKHDCITVCGCLWFLHLYDMLTIVARAWMKRSRSGRKQLREVFVVRVMEISAQMRSNHRLESYKIARMVRVVLAQAEKLAESGCDSSVPRLGLGYALCHAAIRLRTSSIYSGIESATWMELAEESFGQGKKVLSQAIPGTTEWAFAINHCVYVGSLFDIRQSETRLYAAELAALTGAAEWNYRFADTLAFRELLNGRRALELLHEATGREDELTRLARHAIERTRRFLSMAEPSYGDPDIRGRTGSLIQLESDLDEWLLAKV